MSNSAKSHIRIEFKDGVPLGITSATALEQSLRQFYKESRNDDLARPDITITDFELYHEESDEVELTLYSTRRANLDFQVDLLQEYLEVECEGIVEEVNEDTWVQA
jgi:hypothetical protein